MQQNYCVRMGIVRGYDNFHNEKVLACMGIWEWIKYNCIHATTMTIIPKTVTASYDVQIHVIKFGRKIGCKSSCVAYSTTFTDYIIDHIWRLHSSCAYYDSMLAVGLQLKPTDGRWTNTGCKKGSMSQNATYILFQRHRLHVSD
jgi:hypothetical protein